MPAAVALLHGVAALAALFQEEAETVELPPVAALEDPGLDARHGAKAQHQVLRVPVQGRDALALREEGRPRQHAPDVALQVPLIGVANAAEVRVGTRSKAGVLPQLPVFQVVPGLIAQPGEVGDLVLEEAEAPGGLHRGEIHLRLLLVPWEARRLPPGVEGRTLLHFQAVAGEVLGRQGDGGLQVPLPTLQGLVGQAVDEVQGEVIELGLPGGVHRLADLVHGMDPADLPELGVVRRLHTERDPVEPRLAESPQGPPVPGGVGVGLQGDLGVLRHMVALVDAFQNLPQPLLPQEGGRAAAEVDRVHAVLRRLRGGLRQVGEEGLAVGVHPLLAAGEGVEIAVAALLAAEGDMDVKPQGLGFVHKSLPHGRSRVSDGFILPFSANECKPGPSSIPNGRSPLCINLPPLRHPKEKHVRRTLPWT